MKDPYTLASLIVNKADESRIIGLMMDIAENDLICDMTEQIQRGRIDELRRLGEHTLADIIEKEWRYL